MRKYLNKENILSVLATVFFVIVCVYVYFIDRNFYFEYIHNFYWAILGIGIMVLIFLRANYLYFRTNDKRMVIIAAGFITTAIFEGIHAVHTFDPIPVVYMYYFFEAASYIATLYITIIYAYNPIAKDPRTFLIKSYLSFLLYIVLLNLMILSVGAKNIASFLYTIPIQSSIAALLILATF